MRFVVAVGLLVAVSATSWAADAAGPSIDERVAARRAVEETLWRHRLWPSENAQPKPPLSAVLSDAEIRARVLDDLRKSKALEVLWHRPVTPAMLQAELDRMTAGSRAPEVLAEMLAAVDNDPVLAREAIARPALVDRLARAWYARDDRYHGSSRRRAEAHDGGTVTELTWRRDEMDEGAWDEWNARLVERVGRVSDEEDAFRAYAVKERGEGTLRVMVTSWPKRSFDAFWSAHAPSFAPDTALPDADSENAPAPRPALPGPCANDTWRPLGDVTAGPRHSHSAVWTGSEMIVFGGWTPTGATATGGRYVPATDAWYKTSATNAPSARVLHPAVWTGTEMIVWGGQQDLAGPYGPLGDGARYAPATDTWTPIATSGAPSARRELTMIWTGSRAVVFGGIDASTARTNTGGRYDPSTNSWAPTSTAGAPTPRSEHAAVWAGSVMVVWGGAAGASTNTGGRYDPSADTWAPTSTLNAPSARSGATVVWTGSRVIVWGGVNIAAHFQDGGRYDPSADSWSGTTIEGAPGGRELHTAIWTGSQMIVWGGSLGTANSEYNGGGRYDPATDAWTAVSTSSAPERRRSHTAVWSGSEMIVWGGVWELPHPGTFIQYLDNGGRYSPATNSWVPTSVKTNGPPSPRDFHTSVWTGAETVIWGGSVFNDGGRYIAATDSWFPTATAGAPSARSSHSAVWTGSEMIVWGGDDLGFNPVGTGGRYNPSSDTWAGVSIAGAPNGVSVHTAVWTGSRMIVWGGRTSGALSNEGGRYDPSTDTWTATSIVNAPDGRYMHSAAWTGSRMVVWGGSNLFNVGSEGVNTGGRYDPVTDSWTATSTVNAPQGRAGHVSVWTGSSLVVWGGNCCNGTALNTGGRYDPVANSWSATSTAGAPTGRTYASAAWTGLEMIVWGGNTGARVNTGGRYIPATDVWTATAVPGAPSARDAHAAAWAGNSMLVFGGSDGGPLGNGASYCACTPLFRDLDGDGWGGPFFSSASCDGTIPPGYVLRQGDCDDGDVFIHPGALDNTCNGVDEDCNGFNDDLWIGGLSQCGLGVCHATGFFECTNGQIINNCTPGTPLDTFDLNCNNVDEDCDGTVDDDYAQREDYWSPMANSPTSRTNHTTVLTGSEMIVFGGDNGSGTVKTGGDAYAPATNAWRTLAAGPAKRWRHTAVWTGSRMIVWGGDDNVATVYNNGSRYDPATDTWAATTTTGAPAARLWHSAVWTGSRMVVWGGRDAGSSFSSGSRYDPVGNTWSATTNTGAPTARSLHTAVWTGTEMIVWGGFSTAALATGSRYDPAGNTWTAVASAGGLAGRYGHVAVWTGTQMIVWGGTDGSNYFGNGLRYSPSANAWSAMSSTGAPSQRAFASAAWTGTELIVWGGADGAGGGDTLSDGARYNPTTNTWTAMSLVSNPIDRARASGVWTGSELIVWGGDPNGTSKADGGRYVPKTLCGAGGCQRTGHMVCSAGIASFQCVPAAPTPEVCDGLDNDCNVTVDDGIPVPAGHPVLILGRLTSPINTLFSWGAVPGANSYDTVRGDLSQLRASAGNFATSTNGCHFDALTDTTFQDNSGPPPGEGFWFLVRPVNTCSGNGTYNDFAPPQQGARDAEISASGNDCP